jgi:hypothetical protein
MNTPSSAGVDEVPPYEVACIQLDARREATGHHHVTFVETADPDGGRTRWSCVDVIAAIRAGERFVVAEDIRGRVNLLEPGLCTQCPFVTLVVDPPTALPVRCG